MSHVVNVTGDDVDVVRAALAARLSTCWERIEDAISELCVLHEIPQHEIVDRVHELIAAQAELLEAPESALS